MLNSSQKLKIFFTRGRQNELKVYCLLQLFFDLPKRTISNYSNIIILFQQTLKDVEHILQNSLQVLISPMMNIKLCAGDAVEKS